jgi:hypothetical protein
MMCTRENSANYASAVMSPASSASSENESSLPFIAKSSPFVIGNLPFIRQAATGRADFAWNRRSSKLTGNDW